MSDVLQSAAFYCSLLASAEPDTPQKITSKANFT